MANPDRSTAAGSNSKAYEDRRNAAACFKNRDKREEWHADFLGMMVTENLPAGTKCWVNVRKRLTRKGEVYLSVVPKPQGAAATNTEEVHHG